MCRCARCGGGSANKNASEFMGLSNAVPCDEVTAEVSQYAEDEISCAQSQLILDVQQRWKTLKL